MNEASGWGQSLYAFNPSRSQNHSLAVKAPRPVEVAFVDDHVLLLVESTGRHNRQKRVVLRGHSFLYRRLRRAFIILALVGTLTSVLVDDVLTHVRLAHTQIHLSKALASLRAASVGLTSTQRTSLSVVVTRELDQVNLVQDSNALASAQQRLLQAREGLTLKDSNLTTLTTCISGVRRAVSDLGAGQQEAAIDAIGSVSGACQSLQQSSPGGPVYPFDFPDPDVILAGGTYFAYGTNSAGGNIQVIESSNLSDWKTVGNALPEVAKWSSPGYTWAPGVIYYGGRYLLYYATSIGFGDCISVAQSLNPQGPFLDDTSTPLVCQQSLGGSIDPAPYTDAAGNLYLTWKSNGGGTEPATIWAQALSSSGAELAPGTSPAVLIQPSQSWEASVVEAPSMLLWEGRYYLFYSGNNWDTASYAEGVAVCDGPLGPCSKPLPNAIYASHSNLEGPGGGSVFIDAQGNPWIAFHAWLPGATGYPFPRLLFLRRLSFAGGIPQVEPPG